MKWRHNKESCIGNNFEETLCNSPLEHYIETVENIKCMDDYNTKPDSSLSILPGQDIPNHTRFNELQKVWVQIDDERRKFLIYSYFACAFLWAVYYCIEFVIVWLQQSVCKSININVFWKDHSIRLFSLIRIFLMVYKILAAARWLCSVALLRVWFETRPLSPECVNLRSLFMGSGVTDAENLVASSMGVGLSK